MKGEGKIDGFFLVIGYAALAVLFSWSSAASAKVVINGDLHGDLDISDEIHYLAGQEYLLESLRPPEAKTILNYFSDFRKVPATLDIGIMDTALWFTYEIENRTESDLSIYLEMPRQYFWTASMFKIMQGEVAEDSKAGIEVQTKDLAFYSTDSVFHTRIVKGDTARLLFYTVTDGPVDLRTYLSTSRDFISRSYRNNNLNGMFFGIIFGLIIYCAYRYLVSTDRVYVYFLGAVLCIAALFSTVNGFGVSFLWPSFGHWSRNLMMFFCGLSLFFCVKTVESGAGQIADMSTKIIHKIAKYLSILLLVVPVCLSFGFGSTKGIAINLTLIGSIVVLLMMVSASFLSYRQGFRPAIFMAIAFVPILLGTTMRVLALFGVAHGIFLENIFHQSAAAIALILIVISLEDRLVYVRDQQSAESEAIRQKNQQLIENEKLMARDQEATIRVAQMLAHDIRKPFSILRMGINFISRARDYAEVQESLAKLIPEIDAASGNADALILDILEMGSIDKHSIKDNLYPETLITDAIRQAFIVYPQSSITIDYDLRHTAMIFANRNKMMRVFTNIYMNAVQAMHYHGNTWFKSRDVIVNGEPFVEFCIGNAGSYISAENITKIFDAYFTSGKANGTGLGLAVARKVIAGKGGQIWCESEKSPEYPNGKVEFFFTVPVAKGHPARRQKILFSTSADVRNAIASGVIAEHTSDRSGDDTIGFLETELVKRSQLMGRTLRVLVIDDDKFYAERLAALGKNSVGFKKSVSITRVLNAQDAIEAVTGQNFDLIITDVDLGVFSLSGFDLVKQMRGLQVESVVCVHSNRIAASDHKIAAKVGADLYLPKPMGTGQLFRLILQASDKFLSSSVNSLRNSPTLAETLIKDDTSYVGPRESEVVIIIDDSPFVLEAWSAALKGQAKVQLLSSSHELAQCIISQPNFLDRVHCIVTDFYLGEGSLNGLEIARMIKARCPDIPVFLSSDAILADSEWRGIVDRVIGKDPLPFDKLCA